MTYQEKKLYRQTIIAILTVMAFVIFALHHKDTREQEQCQRYPLLCKPEVKK